MLKIAIVEDDINMRKSLEIAMSSYDEYEIKTFKNAKDALKSLDDSFDLVITDINMPGMDGLEFVKELGGRYEVVIMTGNATLQRAIESIHLGVKDFLLKPFEIDTLIKAIQRESKIKQKTKNKKITSTEKNDDFYATSPALQRSLKIAKKAAATDASVLLLGESGVGKEVFAKYIHKNSSRAKKPFIAINMAAIPENLLESELFGYVKGAFTDAHKDKAGLFEEADGGTLFLDEIGEMPYHLQAKLLRALQEKEIRRVGSQKNIKINVRVISATNANLDEKIKNGEFRGDLYYRLNTIPVKIPPLRERKEEILDIAKKAVETASKKYGLKIKDFDDEAKDILLSYSWPGNIRELLSVIERALILSEDEKISSDDLFLESKGLQKENKIEEMEKNLIKEVLEENDKDIKKSAKILGMSEDILKQKIEKYRL